MAKYIDADTLKAEIDKRFYDFPAMVKDMEHMVDEMPAADVEPVNATEPVCAESF